MSEDNKDTSIKKDWVLVAGGVAGFVLLLQLASWISAAFGVTGIYDVVDIASVFVKVIAASTIAWTIKKFVFPNTLGKDFGKTFNEGWNTMSNAEKTRWIIGVFVVLFVTIMLAGSGPIGK